LPTTIPAIRPQLSAMPAPAGSSAHRDRLQRGGDPISVTDPRGNTTQTAMTRPAARSSQSRRMACHDNQLRSGRACHQGAAVRQRFGHPDHQRHLFAHRQNLRPPPMPTATRQISATTFSIGLSVTDAMGRTTSYGYDALSRRIDLNLAIRLATSARVTPLTGCLRR